MNSKTSLNSPNLVNQRVQMLAFSKMKLFGHSEDGEESLSPYEVTKKGQMYLEHQQLLNTIFRALTEAPKDQIVERIGSHWC